MKTKNILSRPTALEFDKIIQEESIRILNGYLIDFLNLALMTKQAHWNMRGSNFIAVHEMLDPFNEKLLEYVDTFAERAVQMGGTAYGTAEMIVAETSFDAYPTDISKVNDHLLELIKRYAMTANNVRADIDANKADAATIDILTAAVEDLDKYVWFMESHLE
jgi:starvation-inducible DNA-binding protein